MAEEYAGGLYGAGKAEMFSVICKQHKQVNCFICLKSVVLGTGISDRAAAIQRIQDLESQLAELTQDRDEWKAKAEALVDALETISNDTIRVEYRGDDFARYEPSNLARIAKTALAAFKEPK